MKFPFDHNYSMKNILKKIIFEKYNRNIRILIVISIILGLSSLIYTNLKFSCQLIILQNLIFPFFISTSVLRKEDIYNFPTKIKNGFFIGGFVGAVSSATTLIADNIGFYFLGGRERAFEITNQTYFPLTTNIIIVGLLNQSLLWLLYSLVSAMSGASSSFFSSIIEKRAQR